VIIRRNAGPVNSLGRPRIEVRHRQQGCFLNGGNLPEFQSEHRGAGGLKLNFNESSQ